MQPEQKYSDLLPETTDPMLQSLLQELDTVYTAPQRPVGLSWSAASQRLTASAPAETHAHHKFTWSLLVPRPRKTWPLAALAALVIAFLTVSAAGPVAQLFGGKASTPFAYAAINKSIQTSNGVTLTAVKGYVDPQHLVLYYSAQIPSNLKSHYPVAFVLKATLQGKDITGSTTCDALGHCAAYLKSNGDIAGDSLKVTWHVTEVELIPSSVISDLYIKGDWTLQFTLPFHHQVQKLPQFFPGIPSDFDPYAPPAQ